MFAVLTGQRPSYAEAFSVKNKRSGKAGVMFGPGREPWARLGGKKPWEGLCEAVGKLLAKPQAIFKGGYEGGKRDACLI